jgi:protein-disulfide isomerase
MEGWNALFLLSIVFTAYSLVLAVISSYWIRSYCMMCIVSYAINLALLFYIWIIKRRFSLPTLGRGLVRDLSCYWYDRSGRIGMAGLVVVVLVVGLFFPRYWRYTVEPPLKTVATGVTEDGHPWIGAADPELEITELTDYLCFQCRKMHYFLRMMVNRHPDKIRLIHRHFPMDHEVNPMVKEPFHEGSGKLAVLSLYAAEEGKFWEMNDLLFQMASEDHEIDLQELADRVGIPKADLSMALAERIDLRNALMKDIWYGIGLKIPGTPAYVVGQTVYLGNLQPEILQNYLD